MLRKPDSAERTAMAAERIVPLDRARTFITLLVVLHHSVMNYTYFDNGDRMRWFGFDLVVLFNDSFFMACIQRGDDVHGPCGLSALCAILALAARRDAAL